MLHIGVCCKFLSSSILFKGSRYSYMRFYKIPAGVLGCVNIILLCGDQPHVSATLVVLLPLTVMCSNLVVRWFNQGILSKQTAAFILCNFCFIAL
jgi:hypothetical protein